MEWTARVVTSGVLNPAAEHMLNADGAIVVAWNDETDTIELIYRINADDLADAATVALGKFTAMTTVGEMLTNGTIQPPTQITLIAANHKAGLPYLSTAALADRLGISDARVRQLASNELEFVSGRTIPGAAGKVYDVYDVATYERERPAAVPTLGRPRAGDADLFNVALALIRKEPQAPLMMDQDWSLAQAITAQGGRYVRGKAKVLRDFVRRHPYIVGSLAQRPEMRAAIARAEEMWAE